MTDPPNNPLEIDWMAFQARAPALWSLPPLIFAEAISAGFTLATLGEWQKVCAFVRVRAIYEAWIAEQTEPVPGWPRFATAVAEVMDYSVVSDLAGAVICGSSEVEDWRTTAARWARRFGVERFCELVWSRHPAVEAYTSPRGETDLLH